MSSLQKQYRPKGASSAQEAFYVLEVWGLRAFAYLWQAAKLLSRVVRSKTPSKDVLRAHFYLERELQMRVADVLLNNKAEGVEAKLLTLIARRLRSPDVRPRQVIAPALQTAITSLSKKDLMQLKDVDNPEGLEPEELLKEIVRKAFRDSAEDWSWAEDIFDE